MELVMGFLRRMPFYGMLRRVFFRYALWKWEKAGRQGPPPDLFKQGIVKKFQGITGYKSFIETGTLMGDMVWGNRNYFSKITTVELSDRLFANAQRRFRNFSHITPVHGDSGVKLGEVLKDVKEPCVIWLDAHSHYEQQGNELTEADFPIRQEIDHLKRHSVKDHIVLIDDARLFSGKNGIPSLEELMKLLQGLNPQYVVKMEHDVVMAYPNKYQGRN